MSNSFSRYRHRAPQWLQLAGCLLAGLLATGIAWGASKLTVVEAGFSLHGDVYYLDARLDLELPAKARRAIDDGLSLRLDYEVEVVRVRRYMIDDTVVSLKQSFELSYHALSQRYLLRNLNTGAQRDFGSLDLAIAELTEVQALPVLDAEYLEEGRPYEVRMRAVLDMSTVPDALQWMLFWVDDWSAESDWYRWPLQL
jgi:hypothetical protein